MIRNILFLILIGIVVIFVFQNTEVVNVKFLGWQVSMSRALMLFATLGIGLVSGWMLTLPKTGKRKFKK